MFKSDILKSSNRIIFYIFFLHFFFIYIKMFKNLSATYYQENKDRLQKNLVKDIKIFLQKKMKKSNTMIMNVTKISQKMKNKSFLSIKKIL